MKAVRTLKREEKSKWNAWRSRAETAWESGLLRAVGCDEHGHWHQGEGQDEAQGEVDEGGAAQQHSQVQHSHQLQDSPALLRPLASQEPLTDSTTISFALSLLATKHTPETSSVATGVCCEAKPGPRCRRRWPSAPRPRSQTRGSAPRRSPGSESAGRRAPLRSSG